MLRRSNHVANFIFYSSENQLVLLLNKIFLFINVSLSTSKFKRVVSILLKCYQDNIVVKKKVLKKT